MHENIFDMDMNEQNASITKMPLFVYNDLIIGQTLLNSCSMAYTNLDFCVTQQVLICDMDAANHFTNSCNMSNIAMAIRFRLLRNDYPYKNR